MKGKILYNKFVRAVSKVIFVILAIIMFAIILMGKELYTSDMIDGSDNFYSSHVLKDKVYNYSSRLTNYLYSGIERYYYNKENNSISKSNGDEQNYDYKDNYDIYSEEGYSEIEIYHTGINRYEIITGIIKEDLKEVLKSSEIRDNLENYIDIFCINYGFRIRYNDEIIFTSIDNENEYEFINAADTVFTTSGDDAYYEHVYIENYIRKNIVQGDEFYKCEKWYNFFNNNLTKIIIAGGIIALLTILLAIYIILTAGYNEDGELETGWLDNIPIELFVFLTIIVDVLIAEIINELYDLNRIIALGIGGMITIWLLVINIETFISRLKNKVFLRKSVFGKMLIFCFNIIKEIFVNIDKKWKACLCICVIFFWEMIIVMSLGTYYVSGASIMMWIFLKIAEFILLMYFYNNISDIRDGAKDMYNGVTDVKIDTRKMSGMFRKTAEYINEVSVGLDKAVAEKIKSEQLKAELITNVSHDIKTPLTSIINYVDLMKKEDIDNEKVKEYLNVVDKQSMRLKKLTEDVIEASKASTGNINVEIISLNISEMLSQSLGEYENKFKQKNLHIVYNDTDEPKYVLADGKLLWRVLDNLFSNIYKYSLEGTRVYIDIDEGNEDIKIIMKNVSENQLNISSDELMQRFVRGDVSRNTSGNGLGLSIAESLTKLQNGTLNITINGDLFISVLSLKKTGSEA